MQLQGRADDAAGVGSFVEVWLVVTCISLLPMYVVAIFMGGKLENCNE